MCHASVRSSDYLWLGFQPRNSVTGLPAAFVTNESPSLCAKADGSSNIYGEPESTRTSAPVEASSSTSGGDSGVQVQGVERGVAVSALPPSNRRLAIRFSLGGCDGGRQDSGHSNVRQGCWPNTSDR
jgi:hypothetical protein